MKLLNILNKDGIIAALKAKDKKSVLEELASSVSKTAGIETKEIVKVLLEREGLGSTGIGGGIAIPHGKLNSIDSIFVGFGLSRKGIDFDSLDNKPVHIFFLLITSENSTGIHLKVLARISKFLKQENFKKSLTKANSREEILKIIQAIDKDF
ncbi:MAG: PTS fructose transporter subunit IIA [Desulfobacteraceae bacterium 4572_130]|nr:MAG: PTS fructose transporter subunit IIA [Desulfobacteraceae bacterium 4572_130]